MVDSQRLKIICLQTSLTAYHYQSYSFLKSHLLQRIRFGLNEERSSSATLVILPECTGSWFYLMCVPMPEYLRNYFFQRHGQLIHRHSLFVLYSLIIKMRKFLKELRKNYWKTSSWFGWIQRSWFSMFSEQSFSLYQQLFSQLAQETNCTIVAGSLFHELDDHLYNLCYVFEPNFGSICLRTGKNTLVQDEITFLDRYQQTTNIYSIPHTNVDIAILICADSWMPETYQSIPIEPDRRFLFIIVALNLGHWNIPWPGYDRNSTQPTDVRSSDVTTLSLGDAWFRYAVHRALAAIEQRQSSIGYGVVCCQGILNLMNEIVAQGESMILFKRSNSEKTIFLRIETSEKFSFLWKDLNEPVTCRTTMDKEILIDVGRQLANLRIYPVFDTCHYVLTALQVREDIQQHQTALNFTRRHPFSCWLSTILLCFSGSILSNFLLGESPIEDFYHHQHLLLATICWYFVFYSPLDLVARLIRFAPIRLIIGVGKEIQRTRKIFNGVHTTLALYPDAYLITIFIGGIKGCGGAILSSIDRFIRGVWLPNQNEFLFPSFATKACFISSTVFLLNHLELIRFERELIYLAVASAFVYVRLVGLFLKQYDPLMPFENFFSGLFFTSWIEVLSDAYRRATAGTPTSSVALTSSNASAASMNNLRKDLVMVDGSIKGLDMKKRE